MKQACEASEVLWNDELQLSEMPEETHILSTHSQAPTMHCISSKPSAVLCNPLLSHICALATYAYLSPLPLPTWTGERLKSRNEDRDPSDEAEEKQRHDPHRL